jgi:hypothetical protein
VWENVTISCWLIDFLITNKLIENTTQKAFLPGINGCIEHNVVMDELVKHARYKNKTAHITFFDLEDAFGSVPHSLIEDSFKRNHLPENIRKYFNDLYVSTQSVVKTSSFTSSPFSFRRRVFQGDPLSPIVFLMVFNPIIQSLKNMEDKFGYSLNDKKIITLPFADDFCLITTNKRSHQNIINIINNQVKSLGMKLKPSKCRSFLISGEKASVVPFLIDDHMIPSIKDEDQIFLGKLLFYSGTSEETFNHIKDIFKDALEYIKKS